MGVLGLDLDKVNLDDNNNFCEDDPEAIIHIRLLAWYIKFAKQIAKHLKRVEWRINANCVVSQKMLNFWGGCKSVCQ